MEYFLFIFELYQSECVILYSFLLSKKIKFIYIYIKKMIISRMDPFQQQEVAITQKGRLGKKPITKFRQQCFRSTVRCQSGPQLVPIGLLKEPFRYPAKFETAGWLAILDSRLIRGPCFTTYSDHIYSQQVQKNKKNL